MPSQIGQPVKPLTLMLEHAEAQRASRPARSGPDSATSDEGVARDDHALGADEPPGREHRDHARDRSRTHAPRAASQPPSRGAVCARPRWPASRRCRRTGSRARARTGKRVAIQRCPRPSRSSRYPERGTPAHRQPLQSSNAAATASATALGITSSIPGTESGAAPIHHAMPSRPRTNRPPSHAVCPALPAVMPIQRRPPRAGS